MRRALSFDDVLLAPNYCGFESRKDVSTNINLGNIHLHIPIISANMSTITESMMASTMHSLGGLGILHRYMGIEENVNEFLCVAHSCDNNKVGVSVGVNEDLNRVEALYHVGARIFCVDVAHGHSKLVNRMIRSMKEAYRDIIVIAGNVCTLAGADYLAGCGADIIKVGVGPGSVCTTRIKTGHGIPQLTAIMDCARCSKPIIADGGIKSPGDVVKALAAGAKAVMIGGMFAGCTETPGDIKPDIGYGEYKIYQGMASKEAYEDFFGEMPNWKTSEGVARHVGYKGPVANVINDIIGGLRSGLTYCGAKNIEELQRKAEFIEITQSGYKESTAHF